MKLQLDESTLNAYVNAALNEELNEWLFDFGAQDRLNSRRMITGQGYGSKKRANGNFWGSANTDISDTDANEVVPQTLVGMIKKMDQGLATIEGLAGLDGKYEGLADTVAAYRNSGGFKMKQSLLNAINALSRLADRLNAVERISGSNAIMESANDYVDGGTAAAAGTNIGVRTGQLTGLQRTARSASALQGSAARALARAEKMNLSAAEIEKWRRTIQNAVKAGDTNFINSLITATDRQYALKVKNSIQSADALKAANIGRNTGFWGKQLATAKNGANGVKTGWNTVKGAKAAGQAANVAGKSARAARLARTGKTLAQAGKGIAQVGKGVMNIAQWPLIFITIADEAARQGAQARQRKIIRTYNCASVLAKRMANIAQEIANVQGNNGGQTQEQLDEINVKKSRSFFETIETGMNELSGLMKQVYAAVKGHQNKQQQVQLPSSLSTPQEIEQFQTWANANNLKDENGEELVPDGIWGPHTEYVYNQVAQQTRGTQMESKMHINESAAVMRALTDLENKVGTTGSGGKAYSDISTMSGAMNGSRSQGARAAKFIIRTYPPVLNQYLGVLSDAGANVAGMQPLKVDTRPLRDYDWQEVQEINTRIQQLLNVARDFGSNNNQNVVLPPKPVVRKPIAKQKQPVEPVQQHQKSDRRVEPISQDGIPQIPTPAVTGPSRGIVRREQQPTLAQSAVKTMGQTANQATMGLNNKIATNRRTAQNTKNAINKAVRDGSMPKDQAKADKRLVKGTEKALRTGKPLKEEAFKKLVKQIITETLNK